MANVTRLDDARVSENFLKELFLSKTFGNILIWTLKNKRSHWYGNVPAQSEINKIAQGDTFFGLGLAPMQMKPTVRCKRENIVGIPGLWLDIDFKSEHHKKTEWLPTEEQAQDTFNEAMSFLGLNPFCTVMSGHGYHAYILFHKVWMFNDDNERTSAAALSQRLSYFVRDFFHAKGFQIDSVYDLARVLRLPGTYNCKDKEKKYVTVEYHDNERYSVDDVRRALSKTAINIPVQVQAESAGLAATETVVENEGVAEDQSTCKPNVGDGKKDYNIRLFPEAEIPLEKYEALCANEPGFVQSWERKKRLKDSSPSGYDMSLACYAASCNWTDQEIVDLLIHHRRKHGSDLKLDRPDYYAASIAKARRIVGKTAAMNSLEAMEDQRKVGEFPSARVVTPEQRTKILQTLSDLFGVGIVAINKYDVSPPEYHLQTNGGSIHMGEVATLLSQNQFSQKVAAACGIAIPSFPAAQWQTIKQRLLDACETIDVGMEARDEGMMQDYIDEFLKTYKPSEFRDKACAMEIPFHDGEKIFIFGSKLRMFIRVQYMTDMSPKKLGILLKQIGCTPTVVNVRLASGGRTTKAAWKLPDEYAVHIPKRKVEDGDE